MNESRPAKDAESEKAYLARSYGALACPTYFAYNVSQPIQLEGDATVVVHMACDGMTVHTGSTSGNRARATLYKNGEEVEDATGATPGDMEPCGDEATNVTITLPTLETEFAPEDVLSIEILVWAVNDGESLHALVGSLVHNSSISSAGLPLDADLGDGTDPGANGTGNQTGGNQTGNRTGGNQTGGNQTGGNRTGNQTGGNQTGGNRTGPNQTSTRTAQPTGTATANTTGAEDEAGAKDVSGEATPGPGMAFAATVVLGGAWWVRRRR